MDLSCLVLLLTVSGFAYSQDDGTCVDHCGGASESFACFCDLNCNEFGDCCSDFNTACAEFVDNSDNPNSCVNKCGTYTGVCGCDPDCVQIGDCCADSDICPSEEEYSCQNRCGNASPDGSCWCDSFCLSTGDCCHDFKDTCPSVYVSGSEFQEETEDVVATPEDESCADRCGGSSLNFKCWCDASCAEVGDCCFDFDTACPVIQPPQNIEIEEVEEVVDDADSCVGHCGGASAKCWCDASCAKMDDCCADYTTVCPAVGPPLNIEVEEEEDEEYVPEVVDGPTCAGNCGSSPSGHDCYCDAACTALADCCDDFEQLCPDQIWAPENPADADPNSCSGKCGEGLASCMCDADCVKYNDCCVDFEDSCPQLVEPEIKVDTCEDFCGTGSQDWSCWCDEFCYKYDDCCEDFTQFCQA